MIELKTVGCYSEVHTDGSTIIRPCLYVYININGYRKFPIGILVGIWIIHYQ